MSHADDRLRALVTLKEQRKQGKMDVLTYYRGLLRITADLIQNLCDEDISEEDAKKQIPFLTLFLEEQIGKLADRGG